MHLIFSPKCFRTHNLYLCLPIKLLLSCNRHTIVNQLSGSVCDLACACVCACAPGRALELITGKILSLLTLIDSAVVLRSRLMQRQILPRGNRLTLADSQPTGLIHLITCPLFERLPPNTLNREALLILCDDIIPAVNVAYFSFFGKKKKIKIPIRLLKKKKIPAGSGAGRMGLDVTEIISSLFPGKRTQKVFLFGQTVMAATLVESVRVGGVGKGAASCVVFVFPAYSGVNRRPAVSARLCCHNTSRLPPPEPPPTTNLLSGCMQWCCRAEPHPLAIAHHRARLRAKDRNPVGLLLTLRLTLRLTLQVISSVSCKKPGLSNHTVISAE